VLYGRVIDISDFGLGAVLSGSLERGDKVVLEFAGGAGNPILTLPAVIRYAQGFRYGFEFSGLSSVEAEHIKRACRSAGVTTTAQGRAGVLQATLSSE
jgi:PilZ domain